MEPQGTPTPKPDRPQAEAVEHVAEAHSLLKSLRERVDKHPELEEAIEKLEMALSILAARSGGLL